MLRSQRPEVLSRPSSRNTRHDRHSSTSWTSRLIQVVAPETPRPMTTVPSSRRLPRNIWRKTPTAVKLLAGFIVCLLLWFTYHWEVHVEIMFYARSWIASDVRALPPLSGKCFTPERISPSYTNATRSIFPTVDFQMGIPMRLDMDCYNFAGTIPHPPTTHTSLPYSQRIKYHTYWRADLVSFGERQEWMLKSFFATQDLMSSTLILWSNDAERLKREAPRLESEYLKKYPEAFEVRSVDLKALAKGTALETEGSGKSLLSLARQDSKAWVDGDLVRLLVIWAHGGVWVDMDSLLTRDLRPLLEHEFITQWDCYNKLYQPFNGALMHFHAQSPYLCEAFHIIATSSPPRPRSTDWGSILYGKLFRRLLAEGIPPFKILPWCFADGRSCRMDNRLPDPFVPDASTLGFWTKRVRGSSEGRLQEVGGWGKSSALGMRDGGDLDKALSKVFVLHLHNQWSKTFPRGGWVDRLLLRRYDATLRVMEAAKDAFARPGTKNSK